MSLRDNDPIAFLLNCVENDVYSVHLNDSASDSKINELQTVAASQLPGAIPDGYIRFLRVTNGAQIENALFESTDDLISLNLDRNYDSSIFLGGSGNINEYVFDLADHQYHIANLGRPSEKLESFDSFENLLSSVIAGQSIA
ncbi:SMI1/KNR4 family protein [Pseudomonas mangrovi]|uniref:SMI1/KNR4 family protein n=1 Tax=Pseudomonas mangrovi TaxID=2161748 RepID=UPI0011B24B16|nr:SMI1/KNR4 family protein [Pseudomonas mangrovi]